MGAARLLNHIQIEDTNIKGAININHALIPRGSRLKI